MTDQHVYSVLAVSLTILKKYPPVMQIYAEGQTRTGGYTNVRLEPRIYIVPPADGIYEFDFVATPPSGPATTALQQVNATYDWNGYPPTLKGVSVYAETNEVTEVLFHTLADVHGLVQKSSINAARGYSNNYDLAEAMRDAISRLPDNSGGVADHLAHYTVVRIGAEIGGIAGFNRMYVDVRG